MEVATVTIRAYNNGEIVFGRHRRQLFQWLAELKSWRAVAMVTTLKRCMGASKELHFGTPHQNTQLRYVAIHAVWFGFQNDPGE